MGSLRDELIRGSAGSLGIKGAYLILQFAVGVALARGLGPEGFGIYSFALAFVALLAIPAQLGVPGLLLRMVAVYQGHGQAGSLRDLVTRSSKAVALLAVGMAGGCIVLVMVFDVRPGGAPAGALVVGALLLPALALLAVNRGALCGLGHVVLGQIPGNIVRPVCLLAALGGLYAMASLNAEAAIAANLGATGAALALGWWLWKRRRPNHTGATAEKGDGVEWLRDAFPFLLLAGAQVVNYQADVLMIGLLMEQRDVGLYRVAVQIADAMGVILVSVSVVIAPHLARLHAKGDWSSLRRILVAAHRGGFAALLVLAGLIVLFGEPLLVLLFGVEYAVAFMPLVILVSGKALYATVGYAGLALSMFGLASVATLVTLVTAGVNVGLNLLLIPSFGTLGAAVATVTSAFIVNLCCMIWMAVRLRHDFSALGCKL